MNYTIYIDNKQKASKFKIECKDEIGRALYNKLPNASMAAGNFELEASKFLNDNSISEII